MGVILDSSVVILAERRCRSITQFLSDVTTISGDQNAALSSVGLTELVHGMYRAKTQEIISRRSEFLRELLEAITVYPYSKETAMLAGRLDGEQAAKGIVIPFPDLLIGATALSLGYSVLTTNMRHFGLIPGLEVLPFQA
jgi:tRNA(fMet)-specific endonuclease VapC